MIPALIATKICHDLAGLSGAIRNIGDLMQATPDSNAETLPLLNETAQSLNARLAYLRALFGTENKAISTDILQRHLSTLSMPISVVGDINSRLQLALAAVGVEALIKGGHLDITPKSVHVAGDCFFLSPETEAVLSTGVPADTLDTLLADWAITLSAAAEKRLIFEKQPDGFYLRIMPL